MTFSNSMNTPSADAIQWGLYSFPASANTSFTQLTLHNTLCANGGGAYRKGNLHFTSYYEDMSGGTGYLYFCTMDLATYTIDPESPLPRLLRFYRCRHDLPRPRRRHPLYSELRGRATSRSATICLQAST